MLRPMELKARQRYSLGGDGTRAGHWDDVLPASRRDLRVSGSVRGHLDHPPHLRSPGEPRGNGGFRQHLLTRRRPAHSRRRGGEAGRGGALIRQFTAETRYGSGPFVEEKVLV